MNPQHASQNTTRSKGVSRPDHPLALSSFRTWIQLLRQSQGIDREFVPRALFVTLTTLLSSPLKWIESLAYRRALDRTAIHPSPIFIVGHWRTGTTLLHNLLCQDPNLGYVSAFQSFAPGFCLLGEKTIKRPLAYIARKRHPTREIDNMALSVDNPEEEELAIANLSPYSVLHWYALPRQAAHFFERYVLFQDLPPAIGAEWREIYRKILRKASLRMGGRRLVLKNCAHTGRIPILLDLFPDAQFIHIYRNPYDVFCSTMHMVRIVLSWTQLQTIGDVECEALVVYFYRRMMQQFLADRCSIPAGNLVQVRFEDLEREPLGQIRRIYETLNMPGFDAAEPGLRAYLASIDGYQKNRYERTDEVITKVNDNWQFAFDEWDYERLEPVRQADRR